MVRSLPLRRGFFATPQVTDNEETELLEWGRSLGPELFHPDIEWSNVQEKNGVQMWEDRQKGGMTYSVRATTHLRAVLDDVMDIFMTSSTLEFRALMEMQLRDYHADSAVLYTKEYSDMEMMSIKWFAMRNRKSVNLLVSAQDFCVFEYVGLMSADFVGGDPSQLIGVCLYESIEQMECPSLWETHKLERGFISKCGYLFRPRPDGWMDIQFLCTIRQPSNQRTTRRVNRTFIKYWAQSIGRIDVSLDRRRMSREMTIRRSPQWVHDEDRHCCLLCMKTFSNTRRRHHCRICGEVICRRCSLYKAVDLQVVGVTTLRVCKACVEGGNEPTVEDESYVHHSQPIGESTDQYRWTATSLSSSLSSSEGVELPPGVNNEILRDAVDEYALTVPSAKVSPVPDLVGIAWLQQLAERMPEKKEMVSKLMEHIQVDCEEKYKDLPPVDIYDTLCDLAAQAMSCKFAVVSLIEENRQWFKSSVQVSKADIPRDFTFCEVPVRDHRPFVVMDATQDLRFNQHPFVTGSLGVRFIAGAPLFTSDTICVGSVCVMDTEPREYLQDTQIVTMQNLAHLAMVMVQEQQTIQAKSDPTTQQIVHMTNLRNTSREYYDQPISYESSPYESQDGASPDFMSLHSTTVRQQVQPLQRPHEDPVLREQMVQLLHQASKVRDQVIRNNLKQVGLRRHNA